MGLNGLALQGFMQGGRLAEEDQRTRERFPLEQQQRMLANDARGMQNDRYMQETPYYIDRLGLSNDALSMQNDRYSQETPLHTRGMSLSNDARSMQNQRYQQETPLYINGVEMRNRGSDLMNQQRDLNLQSAQQMQPTENAYNLQKYQHAMTQNRVADGVNAYRSTGNIGHLKQAIDSAYGGNVQITPMQDGRVQVMDDDGSHVFNSMDEFVNIIGQQAATASGSGKAPQDAWVSIGNGYIANRRTGETKQAYTPQPKTTNMLLKPDALMTEAGTYVDSLGLDLSSADENSLKLDIASRSRDLMAQGVNPSLALRQAYDAVSSGITGEPAWIGAGQTYNPGTATNQAAMPQATGTGQGAYNVPGYGQITEADIAETARASGMTVEQVRQRLGL